MAGRGLGFGLRKGARKFGDCLGGRTRNWALGVGVYRVQGRAGTQTSGPKTTQRGQGKAAEPAGARKGHLD